MGDTGALVCGFLLSVVAIAFIEQRTTVASPVISLSIFFYPVFDTLRVAYLRLCRSRSPFSADRNHTHHILHEAGLSQLQTVSLILLTQVGLLGLSLELQHLGNELLIVVFAAIAFLLHRVLCWVALCASCYAQGHYFSAKKKPSRSFRSYGSLCRKRKLIYLCIRKPICSPSMIQAAIIHKEEATLQSKPT